MIANPFKIEEVRDKDFGEIRKIFKKINKDVFAGRTVLSFNDKCYVKTELDYDDCYYEGDVPSAKATLVVPWTDDKEGR